MEYSQKNWQSMNNPIASIGAILAKPYLLPVLGYRAKVRVMIDKDDFIVKTAESSDELDQIFRLRHEVFIHELLGRKNLFGVDMDRYDQMCDYLIVIEKSTGCCIGTYRLISDLYSDEFYSSSEFDLGLLPSLDGIKLEIGRACIKKEYRKSNMMGLLWEGIYQYIGKIQARYVFGCSSIMTMDRLEIAMIHQYLVDNNYHRNDLSVKTKKKYTIKTLGVDVTAIASLRLRGVHEKAEALIPRLITDYIKFGARVCGEPAMDRNFRCIDIFTILDLQNLNNSYREERTLK